jgi:hypothetical protein
MVIKTIHCMQFQVRCQPTYHEGVVDDLLNREKPSIANDAKIHENLLWNSRCRT